MSSLEAGNSQLPSSPPEIIGGYGAGIAISQGPKASSESELVKALRRRWLLACTVGTLCAAVAATVTWFAVPMKLTARARLKLSSKAPVVMFQTNDGEGDFFNYQRTQKELLTSRPVLNAALKDPTVVGLSIVQQQLDPADWLEQQLKVDFAAPEILDVTLQGDDKEVIQALLKAVTKAYLLEIVEKERSHRTQRYQQLSDIRAGYEETLRQKRANFKKLAQTAGAGDAQTLEFKHRLALEQLHSAEQDLINLKSELRKLEVEAKLHQGGDKHNPTAFAESAIEDEIAKDATMAELRARRQLTQQRISENRAALSSPETADHVFGPLKRDLETIEAQLAARHKELRPAIEEDLRKRAKERSVTDGTLLQKKLTLFQELEKTLEADVKRLGEQTRTINHSSLDLEGLRQEISQADDISRKIAAEAEALRVELQAAPPRVTLLEDAMVRSSRDKRKFLVMVGVAGVGAFGFGALGVGWHEYRRRKIKTVAEVVDGLGVRLMGAIPNYCDPRRPGARGRVIAPYSSQQLLEHVDAARARLLYTARTQPFRVLMVTSAIEGEGKTSLASHLAASIARAGRRTLLLDCDLRKPSAHRLFDQPMAPGFSELLRGELDLADVERPTFVNGLSLIPAGNWDPSATEALANDEKVRGILERLKEQYEFILLDTSPVLAVADTLWVAQYVDAAVLSVLYDVSHLPSLETAYQELTGLGTRVLGIVMAGMPQKPGTYGYGSYPSYAPR